MVSALDEAVGKIVQTLLLQNMLKNTVIIFSTDVRRLKYLFLHFT